MADAEYALLQQPVSKPGEGSAQIAAAGGKKWIKQKAHEETQWTVIGLCGFFLATILQKGQFLFKMSAQNSLIQLINSQELNAGK